MDIKEKLEINKLLRKYEGNNGFLISLKKSLSGKWCQKIEFNGSIVAVQQPFKPIKNNFIFFRKIR